MNRIQKTTTGLTLIALTVFGGQALAQSNDNTLAFNTSNKAKAELTSEKKKLNAPVVMPYLSSAEAQRSSKPASIGIHIHHDADDPISGFRYARGLANAATEDEKTGNRPMYITATYEESASSVGSFVSIYVDGKPWSYEGNTALSPQVVAQLLPILMYEYEQSFGKDNFIPEDVTPQLVASLD
ncbi:MAG: hypothetical protein RLN81_03035 [Balneolaceae bacterium]